jgi:MFS family permease
MIDLAPLRRSRDFRLIVGGQLLSTLGTQLTAVAVPYQVFRITGSSLDVGLVSLAQLVPLLVCSLYGGSVIDAVDRRRLLVAVGLLMAASSAGLGVNADLGPALWPLFVAPAFTAGLAGFASPARNAMVPRLVGLADVPTAAAMFQALYQFGSVVGPAVGGLLLAGAGVHFVYWADVAGYGAAVAAAWAIAPQPPDAHAPRPGLRSIIEGFAYVRSRQEILGAYVIDIDAMVFGMPRALFPALALRVFKGGARTLGFLYSSVGVGALLGALTTGWVTRVRRQGLAVTAAVLAWGAAITAFGLVHYLPVALVLLAVAGWADVISAVFRNTIIQLSVPDRLRGRLQGFQIGVVQGGPRLGDLEAGGVASAVGIEASIVSGGALCILGALVISRALPRFRKVTLDPSTTTAPS